MDVIFAKFTDLKIMYMVVTLYIRLKKKNPKYRSSTGKANVNKFWECLQPNMEELKFFNVPS